VSLPATLIVASKELRESMRDRRSLLSALLFPLFGPLIVSLMLTQVLEQATETGERTLPVLGAEHAPGLIAHLEQQDFVVVHGPTDADRAVREGEQDVVLIIPSDYGKRFRDGQSASVQLVVDRSRNDTHAAIRQLQSALSAYGQRVGTLRLMARGVDPQLARPVSVVEIDQATPQKMAATFLNVIPLFVLLAAFVGGLYTATDCTAGERERGSLEALLLTPTSRRALLRGKWIATTVFSAATVILTYLTCAIALSQVPLDKLNISFELDAMQAVGVLTTVLPLCVFVAGLQVLVASFAQSVKEAQTYLSLMMLLPMIPGALLTISPLKSALWMMLIPVFGQQVLLMDALRGDTLSLEASGIAALLAILLGLLLTELAAHLHTRERVVFGR